VATPVRGAVAVCRFLHYLIVAILFVKAIGFGALAGTAALVVASVGFVAKLFAEAVEEISMKQVEAVRATGAGLAKVLAYAVLPQVASRFVGFCSYQLDSNLRNSTLVGVVGARGHRRHAIRGLQALRLRLRLRHPAFHRRTHLLAELVSDRVRSALR